MVSWKPRRASRRPKAASDGRTLTSFRKVEGEERRRELARMLSGRIDEASLAHAEKLLVGEHGLPRTYFRQLGE